MSPRKSSTSSGRPRPVRPRYLGLEVAGEHLPPLLSPRWWEQTLRTALGPDEGGAELTLRVIRSEGPRAIVAVDQFHLARARAAWNRPADTSGRVGLSTRRAWGTLVGAKAWIRRVPRRR